MGLTKKIIISLAMLSTMALAASTNENEAENSPSLPTEDPKKAFLLSVSMIAVSEIGDKTFLIAALMAMRYPRLLVFSASASSLFLMTIISGVVGRTFTSMIPESYTHFLAGILFLVFGYKLTLEGLAMSKDMGVEEELAEVEEEIAIKDLNKNMGDVEAGSSTSEMNKRGSFNQSSMNRIATKLKDLVAYIFTPVWIQTFSMVFLGEFGDRSQISTIAMASGSDYWYVILGAIVGHAICTAIAVIGGKMLAAKITMRTVTLGGAFSFFIFAILYIHEAFVTPN